MKQITEIKSKGQIKHLLSSRSKLTDNQKRIIRRLKEPQVIKSRN